MKQDAPDVETRYARRIAHAYFVRFHMGLILAAVIASGVLTSKGLLALGLHSLRLRYPIGVLASYLVFLGLVRIWIWYVSAGCALQVGNLDFSGGGTGGSWGGSSGGGGFGGFGGGDSGGAGASSSWDSDAPAVVSEPTSSGWLPKLDLDCDLDDGWWILVLLVALVLLILGAGGYLVYAAPHILPEAAGQALLATTLTRVSKEQHHNWMAGVFRATCIPFALVLILASILGWEAHKACPAASRLIDVFHCSSL